MRIQEWKEKGQYFTFEGKKIFYRAEGSGVPILCIHGFPTCSWDWASIWPELSRQFQVLAPDLIGFGFSDKPRQHSYSIANQADMLEAFAQKMGVNQVHILAHDYGDTVAQELLARFERLSHKAIIQVKSVCFLNGGLFPETHRPLLIQKLLMSPIGFLISKISSEQIIKKRFYSVFAPQTQPTEAEWADYWTGISHQNGKGIAHRLIRYMQERIDNREKWVSAMQNTAVPLKLIDGKADPISGEHMAQRYAELIPEANISLLENVGHYPQTEAPEQVLKYYLAFLESIS